VTLEPDDLKREIDETLDELDRLEAEVVDLFGELLGPEAAMRVAAYMQAKERDPQTAVLRRGGAERLPTTATTPGPSTAPPAPL
jgi:hypothetical protein